MRFTAESAQATAEERSKKKKREKRANRAVVISLWAVLLGILGAAGYFVYSIKADHSGEKLWQFERPGSLFKYAVKPHSSSLFLLSAEGSVNAISLLSGQQEWTATLPEQVSLSRPLPVDSDRCLVYSANTVSLCTAAKTQPAWTFNAPLPYLSREPTVQDDRLYVSSTGMPPGLTVFSELFEAASTSSAARERFSAIRSLPRPNVPTAENATQAAKKASTISAVDMASGSELWRAEIENISVGGLFADKERVYVAGYPPFDYSTYTFSQPEKTTEEDSSNDAEQDEAFSTQLWALNAATGKPEWKLEGTGHFLIPPMSSSNGIVFSTEENIYLVSPEGKVKWNYPLHDKGIMSLQPFGEKLFVTTTDGFLVCLDLASGSRKWVTAIGSATDKIVVNPPFVYVSGAAKVEKEMRKGIPTKRWQGSEDLLKKALKSAGTSYEMVLHGIDIETGEKRWAIPKITGDFEFAGGRLYALRYFERFQMLDPSVDSSEITKTISNLGAYDATTGEKLWEAGIDGYASDLRLTDYVAIVTSHTAALTFAANEPPPPRLVGISLY